MDKQHILVVDDNHINRLFFESSIKKLSFAVTLAKDGFEAVTLCQSKQYDLILMDIRMNGMDGIQTASAIKQLPQHSKTPIFAISAEHFDCTNHNDFVGSLLKPIGQDLLQKALSKYLDTELIFDHQEALQVSHYDEKIVQKLRALLLNQLPNDLLNLQKVFVDEDWQKMDDMLHKLMGSAKVCAASLLINAIKAAKKQLRNHQKLDSVDMSQLELVIEKTRNFSE